MTGLVRKALTIAGGLAVVASVASAGVPDPRNSSVENVIIGSNRTTALGAPSGFGTDAVPGFEVTVRDVNNTPLTNRTVVIDYSATTGAVNCPAAACMKIGVQAEQAVGTTVNCAAKTLSKQTDGGGLAVFTPNQGGFTNSAVIEVSSDGVVLATVKGRSTDIDGNATEEPGGGTTGLNDFSIFSDAFLNDAFTDRETNFDNACAPECTGLNDFSIFSDEFLSEANSTFCN